MLLGEAAMNKLAASRVAVFGVGGVGGYVVEALARSGVGEIDLIDNDEVVLMPAVLGLDDDHAVTMLRAQVSKPLHMVATLPPAVPGARLHTTLRHYFQMLGGTYLMGDTVQRGTFEGNRLTGVHTAKLADTVLQAHHVGTLASLGFATCEVRKRIKVGIISTGDEIVPVEETPVASQMRDVNAPVLAAAVEACGAEAVRFPIVPDDYDALLETVKEALVACDVVLVSGGSSAGQKDNTARVLKELGDMLFHGVAVKPGKPTMCADVNGVPAFGLPGHPVAAYFMFLELVRPLLARTHRAMSAHAVLAEGLPSNHGRAELVAIRLEMREGHAYAVPVRGKSGLISQLSMADGYLEINRNQEGLAAGALVNVQLF